MPVVSTNSDPRITCVQIDAPREQKSRNTRSSRVYLGRGSGASE